MEKNKKRLLFLSTSEYEHPFDTEALNNLKRIPGLDSIGRCITRDFVEPNYRVQYTGSSLKVDRNSYPRLYEYLEYACKILEITKEPELYSCWGYNINACTIGADNPAIILNSGLIDLCTDDEIMFILGHELGHIKSCHMLYHMMAQLISNGINFMQAGNVIALPLKYALLFWFRMSEFTADRAGLLCCQNKDAAISSFVKMSGLPMKEYGNLSTEAFLRQARDFQELDYDMMNRIFRYASIMDQTHPWTVMRAAELIKWIDEGRYDRVANRKDIKVIK